MGQSGGRLEILLFLVVYSLFCERKKFVMWLANYLKETKAAFQDPKAAAALQKWRSLGESKNVIAELTRY